MVLENLNTQSLVFTNKTIKSKKHLLIRFLIAFVAAIAISFIFNFEDKSTIIPIMIGLFVGTFITNYNTYNKVILTNENISFLNVFTKAEKVFTYSEITLFKSNIITNQYA